MHTGSPCFARFLDTWIPVTAVQINNMSPQHHQWSFSWPHVSWESLHAGLSVPLALQPTSPCTNDRRALWSAAGRPFLQSPWVFFLLIGDPAHRQAAELAVVAPPHLSVINLWHTLQRRIIKRQLVNKDERAVRNRSEVELRRKRHLPSSAEPPSTCGYKCSKLGPPFPFIII